MHIFEKSRTALLTILTIGAVFVCTVLFDVQNKGVGHSVQATSTATTTVTVLNTPPVWTVTAREWYESSATNPTNAGELVWWTAIATDSNAENYYLLICKSSSTPVAIAAGPPRCGGGTSDQWAVSAATASGASSTVSTTTQNAWATTNNWYGYICDGNAGSPRCNAEQFNGAATGTSSPFVVNHRPTLTAAADDSPTLPGAITTWTTTSSDPDGDTVKIHVCKATDYSTSTDSCGPGGFWASSSAFVVSNASATGTIPTPMQDTDYGAYVYLIDQFGSVSASALNGQSTILTVANAAPTVIPGNIWLYDVNGTSTSDTNLALTVEEGQTNNFYVVLNVTDDNSCQAAGGGNEINDLSLNVFRNLIGGAAGLGCDASGEYDANNCYTDTNPSFAPTCYQVPGDCTGPGQISVDWECRFPLWYVADPTDVGSFWAADTWGSSVIATDDDAASSALTVSTNPSEMTQFLSFRATGTPITYGSLEPGNFNPTHFATTTVYATGNTGLNHYLSGDAMCVGYPNTCTGFATSTIFVQYQHYSLTEGAAYAAGTPLTASSTPVEVDVDIQKPTDILNPTNDSTFWAIEVPATITFAGDYVGRNYIEATVAPSGEW